MEPFRYENTEVIAQKGGKLVRKVSIKKGRGTKSVTTYRNGKRIRTVKKRLHKRHISRIKRNAFIRGLGKTTKRRGKRRGGSPDNDLEMGSESPTQYLKSIPPDPERFAKYDAQIKADSFAPKPVSEVASVFAGPTPEGKQDMERHSMMDEDPLYKDPFETEDLRIFSNKSGGKKQHRR